MSEIRMAPILFRPETSLQAFGPPGEYPRYVSPNEKWVDDKIEWHGVADTIAHQRAAVLFLE